MKVSKAVRRNRGKTHEYEAGDNLICIDRFKIGGDIFHRNFKFKVTKVQDDVITLDEKWKIPIDIIRKRFIYGYCRTAHSMQGKSIKNPITIFDWKHRCVTNEWLYVAVSRCTDLNNVTFSNYIEDENTNDALIKYFKNKVENYKKQDKKAKRQIDENNYINIEWMFENINTVCSHCEDVLEYEVAEGKVISNFTAHRPDCTQAHHLDNIMDTCLRCNVAMGNRCQ